MHKRLNRAGLALVLTALLIACTKMEADSAGVDGEGIVQAGAVAIRAIEPDADATAATFQDLSGRPLEIADFNGRKVLLNYWATWCAPCIEEIPALSRAAQILGPEGYVVLLASDESLETISTFIAEYGFSGNFIKLNNYFATHGIQAVPSTVLFDENGQELRVKSP